MPISAIGRRSANGFTLIELMVVMTIVALASAAVVLALPNGRDQPQAAAMAFAAHAGAARDAAIIGSRDTRVRVTNAGYAVEQRRGGAWQALPGRDGRAIAWPPEVAVAGAAQVTFDTTGGSTPATLALAHAGRRADVAIAADGAIRVTP